MKKLVALALTLVMALSMITVASAAEGKVYYLNFKPEADAAWQALAKTYTEQTGVEVKVVTAASGTYNETLTAEMDKGADAPTLFQNGSQSGIETWDGFMLDLTDTELAAELTVNDFNLYGANGELYALGFCYEGFGLITNKALLEKAGYTVADITGFEALKAIAEDIHARKDELGFDAFSPAGLDGSSSWRFTGHLISNALAYEFEQDGVTSQPATIKGTFMDNVKNIWDLYINNSSVDPTQLAASTGDESEAAFGEGKAVFYQNGTWEYANLTTTFGMKDEDLVMLPIYMGIEGEENYGLACGTENCWSVNSQASEADQKATLDFLKWVVTSDEGTTMMAEQFGPIPFKNAKTPTNVFFNDASRYIEEGKANIFWAFTYTPNTDTWRAGVAAALTQYSAGTGSWDDVVTAAVQGWATQYANQ